jgi:hypothetical protein
LLLQRTDPAQPGNAPSSGAYRDECRGERENDD